LGAASHGRLSVAVDIGGTFTDLVAFDQATGEVSQSKSLTTHGDLPQAVWDCLRKATIAPRNASTVVHGSTIAINIAIEEKGAETALVVTRGTRDVYKIGRQNRPEAYNFRFKRPVPLVPRSRTFECNERLAATGERLTALAQDEIARIVAAVRASGAAAVAVCFLHSYADVAPRNNSDIVCPTSHRPRRESVQRAGVCALTGSTSDDLG